MTVSRFEMTPGRFVAHELALSVATMVFGMVGGVPRGCADLAEQARRAVASVPLNLAEGAGRAGKDRAYHFRIAYGSVKEVESAVRLLVAVGAIESQTGDEALGQLDRLGAMTWRLIGRPGPGR